ncbi:MAG: 6,7-dimethyl-8-ribityllumazine synthase [Proteobacteria bacterium]|nr:6,7-dimethyl-8-ribityllumazine synthase [Pseudomonadota bacterium]
MDRHHSQDDHIDAAAAPADRIAFVQACWHKDIVERGRDAFIAELARRGHPPDALEVLEVPGSFEIPLQAQILAKSGRYAAVVAAGFVVDGGIYRHEFVAATVLDALMRIQLDTGVPMISVVLTPQRFHEHDDHRRFFREHFEIKGAEAATACLATIANLKRASLLRASPPRRLAKRRPAETRAAS